MEKWFSNPPNITPKTGGACTDIVTLDWVLKFPRAKQAYQEIFDNKLWMTRNAQKEMASVIKRKGLLKPNVCLNYNHSMFKLPTNHLDHIQYNPVSAGDLQMAFGRIDHLTAALARFNFYITAYGTVIAPQQSLPMSSPNQTLLKKHVPMGSPIRNNSQKYQFIIDEIGVYLKDSYDFNDLPGQDQPLGNWDIDDDSVGRTVFNGGVSVSNSDFREWRKNNKKGGDYLIYSDTKYTKLATPDIVYLES